MLQHASAAVTVSLSDLLCIGDILRLRRGCSDANKHAGADTINWSWRLQRINYYVSLTVLHKQLCKLEQFVNTAICLVNFWRELYLAESLGRVRHRRGAGGSQWGLAIGTPGHEGSHASEQQGSTAGGTPAGRTSSAGNPHKHKTELQFSTFAQCNCETQLAQNVRKK